MYRTDPAQPLTTAGRSGAADDLDYDLSVFEVRTVSFVGPVQ